MDVRWCAFCDRRDHSDLIPHIGRHFGQGWCCNKCSARLDREEAEKRQKKIDNGCVECGTKAVDVYRHLGAYCNRCHDRAIANNDINPYGAEAV